jgi:amino acid transporter
MSSVNIDLHSLRTRAARQGIEHLMESIPTLKRSLGLGAVVALGINGVIGQGIFLLPGRAAGLMGPASLAGIGIAAVLCLLIALCFAEVGSRFSTTGGAYVYAREAFGDFVGFEVGWMTCCVAVISWAALANGFTLVLGSFVPAVTEGWLQKAVAVGLMVVLTLVNLRGAKQGAMVSTFFSVAKMAPLLVFIIAGAFAIDTANFQPFAPQGYGDLAETTLILLYAFVGFETLVVPAGEMDDPQRSVPRALIAVMAIVSVVYLAVLTVSIGTLPEIAGHPNPVAAAASRVLGPAGGTIVAIGIVISVFGTNSGAALVSPRRFFAMAERGDLPALFARVHPTSGVPVPALLLTLFLSSVLAITGSFVELAALGVLARFLQYIPTCFAVIVLRKRSPEAHRAGFRLPLGPTLPLLTVALCCILMANTNPDRLIKGSIALVIGALLYGLSRIFRSQRGTHAPVQD